MSNYSALFSPSFKKCLQKHQHLKKRVEKFVNRILQNPYYKSEPLTKKRGINLTGKKSRHMTGNFVLVYMICEDCISKGFQNYNGCNFCDNTASKRVIFLAFDKHDDIYSREWKA